MPKINKLDSSIYNLISAGEVVERPSSVIKELVENSIDAGANEISVYIEEGGIKNIKVVDNGCGMDKENIYLSYLPHATSKLEKASDLDNISTLGFRGEALASIAAVSQLKISSKEACQDFGYFIEVNSGNIVDEGEIGLSNGTIVEVKNLFFNTPVRLKFLKTPKQEESIITSIMAQLIFANYDVKFKYYVDNNLVYQTSGGLENAIYSIYDNNTANRLIPFKINYNNYEVFGYTGNRELFKHNKNYQTIIVNGRAIQNQNIQVAVAQAYGNTLMKRCFAVFVLYLNIPFDEVDVNVHPTKAEVRFQDNHKVFSAVYRAIMSALETQFQQVSLNQNILNNKNEQNDSYLLEQIFDQKQTNTDNENKTNVRDYHDNIIKKSLNSNNFRQSFSIENELNYKNNSKNDTDNYSKTSNISNISDVDNQNKLNTSSVNTFNIDKTTFINTEDKSQLSLFNQIESDITQGYEIIGQIFDTYLILQSNGKAYLIDQHACHERFLYDNLLESINNKQIVSQKLLIPYIIECTSNQYDYMLKIRASLESLGFSIEEFGSLTFKVNEIPNILVNLNLAMFFEDILNDKNAIQSLKTSDLILEKLAQRACKSAIKAGDKLTSEQISHILKQMTKGIPMQCPHGRPAIIEFSRKDLDKLFKRIV